MSIDQKARSRVVLSHLALVALQAALYFIPSAFPDLPQWAAVHASVVTLASLTVYAGCWRSIKPDYKSHDALSEKDAYKFPFVGSAVLFSLYIAYKFLPPHLLNMVIRGYFSALGVFAIAMAAEPLLEAVLPKFLTKELLYLKQWTPHGWIMDPTDVRVTPCNAAAALASAAACVWYFRFQPWIMNNVLGLAYCLEGIEWFHLGSVWVGVILMSGLFVYDVFWVFGTPVMVSVAKKLDGPIKLLFIRAVKEGKPEFSILGLGDIVLPATLIAMMLKLDASRGYKTSYFRSAMIGYVAGLVTTVLVMGYFKAAQPALLYLVPGVIGAIFIHSAAAGEIKTVFGWSTEGEGEEEGEAAEGKGEEKKDK